MTKYTYVPFAYETPPELKGGAATDKPVAIIGAGPIGLTIAIDLALHGVGSVVLDDNDVVSVGSRAICWAKRSLEIFDRLGVGDRMIEKGVTWKVGRVFHGEKELYSFDLLPESGHKMPAFINLQQYYVEQYLVERALEFPDLIDLRWKNRVVDHVMSDDGIRLSIETPDGPYQIECQYALACDGANSPTRKRMGLELEGQSFDEQFLITDVEMEADPFGQDGTPERWFWFEPPFFQGQSALLHKQPDNIYRIDLQLGPDADPEREKDPDTVRERIAEMIGDLPFTIDWMSIYKFTCARLERFVHDRMIFLGDSAHMVSPFGARGGNGGIQDADNLGWKLAALIKGDGTAGLLESYQIERTHGADENIMNSQRSTNFMTPKSEAEKIYRDEVLSLAGDYPFARKLVNSGRLSVPCSLEASSLQTPSAGEKGVAPGTACPDAPVSRNGEEGWLLNHLGNQFTVLTIGNFGPCDVPEPCLHVNIDTEDPSNATGLSDKDGYVSERYSKDIAYLIRPDQHVAARFVDRADFESGVGGALKRAQGAMI